MTEQKQENPLEKHKRKIKEKVAELLETAQVKEVKLLDFTRNERQYLVTIYEESTEFLACMEMLAKISKWFNVKPLK